MFTPVKRILEQLLTRKRISYVDITIAGRVIGGRLGEAPQHPTAYQTAGTLLVFSLTGMNVKR